MIAERRYFWIATDNQPKRHAQAARWHDRNARTSAERALWAATVLRQQGWLARTADPGVS